MSQAPKTVTLEQFRGARAMLGWSRSDLAERAGVSLPTVQRVETEGKAFVSDEIRQKLKATLEAAGVEFTNGNAPGGRLRKKRS